MSLEPASCYDAVQTPTEVEDKAAKDTPASV
jgi:hypothetical protein